MKRRAAPEKIAASAILKTPYERDQKRKWIISTTCPRYKMSNTLQKAPEKMRASATSCILESDLRKIYARYDMTAMRKIKSWVVKEANMPHAAPRFNVGVRKRSIAPHENTCIESIVSAAVQYLEHRSTANTIPRIAAKRISLFFTGALLPAFFALRSLSLRTAPLRAFSSVSLSPSRHRVRTSLLQFFPGHGQSVS